METTPSISTKEPTMKTEQFTPCRKRLAVYPGTFDPITRGHIDIIERALTLFDDLIISVAVNPAKTPLFSKEERVEMILQSFPNENRISVEVVSGLVVDFAAKKKATALIRGLRAVSDFDYEFQIALANRNLNQEVESVFLMPSLRWIFISSSIIKDIAKNNGDISDFVPPHVNDVLRERFAQNVPKQQE